VAIGGGALISTYWVPRPLVFWDLPWETITGALLWIILWVNKGKIGPMGRLLFDRSIFYLCHITNDFLFSGLISRSVVDGKLKKNAGLNLHFFALFDELMISSNDPPAFRLVL
jgi:hypothetical protein